MRTPRNIGSAAALALAAFSASCASAGNGNEVIPIPSMRIENQSEFDLDELRIHETADFTTTKNVFPGGAMKMNAALVFYGTGEWWVTVIHPLVKGDRPIAFTTQTPIEMELGKAYELIVFDQSFRLKEVDKRVAPNALMGVPSYGDPGPLTMSEKAAGTSTRSKGL